MAAAAVSALGVSSALAQERVLGVDVSYWNTGSPSGNGITQANWNTGFSTGNRKFAFIRATRGGTTGVDQPQGTPPPHDSASTLSRRYDDPRFIQNINRAAASGMYAGAYHFGRPDIAGNTGTDEANHFIQMAGPWMRPGYMMPTFDLEAGSGAGGDALAQFSIDFSNRLYQVMQIRPAMYINGNYSNILQNATASRRNQLAQPGTYTPSVVGPAYPMLWNARYSDEANPDAIPVQTGSPKHTYTTVNSLYGPWDDYGNTDPWHFWQYASTVNIPGFNAVDSDIDGNVAHGDIEFVRNYLVPAVWWNDSSGDWSTLANWNSGQTPVQPIAPSDQATPYETGPLPTPRLPGASGSGSTSGQYDTVILERPNSNITVTVSTGTHNVRKLYMREALNITGGTLSVNYDPTYRPDNSATVLHGGPVSAQFSGPVTLSGSGTLNVHTLQLDAAQTFTLAGGTLAFNTINLISNSSTKIAVTGNVNLNPLNNAAALIKRTATTGTMDLGGGQRTLTIGNGTAAIDVDIQVPITNGGLTKSGVGTLQLSSVNTYTGATNITQGTLNLTGSTAVGSVVNISPNTFLSGTGTVNGNAALNGNFFLPASINFSPGGSIQGTLTVNSGAWNGVGTVVGTVTSQSGTFTIGSAGHLTANAILEITGGRLNAGSTASTITGHVHYASASDSTWAGVIAGVGKTLSVANSAGTITLTGANTYTGPTNVDLGTLRLNASNNINNTSGVFTTMSGSAGGTVRLSDNITINRPLAIGGAGLDGGSAAAPGSIGALDNLSGTNIWAGNITLNGIGSSAGDQLNQISSTAGSLVLSGVIQNGTGASWAKTLDGDVVLAGAAANTYTNLTRVFGGRLIIEKDGALGAAGSAISADGNTFMLAGSSSTIAFRSNTSLNYSTYEWINLEGNGAPGFGQLDNLGGDNTFAGQIGLNGPGGVSTIGVSAGSLNLTGGMWTYGASGARTLEKIGPATLIISGDSSGLPTNVLDNGVVTGGTMNVNAGVVETHSPTATTTNMPGMTTWNVAGGAVLKNMSGILAAETLNVSAGGLVELAAGGGAKTLRTRDVMADGRIDLADHRMIVDYDNGSPIGSWNGTAYSGLTGAILDGRNGGAWDGNGIVTSMPDAQGAGAKTTLGITEAAQALGLSPGQTGTWRGQAVDATTVLIAYTYPGDADLSGAIDGDDYFQIDAGYNAGADGFGRGDFNYDGQIDADDYFILDLNYSRQYPPLLGAPAVEGVSSVPEPSAALALGALAVSLLVRRRRAREIS